jgi:hypothetical protein
MDVLNPPSFVVTVTTASPVATEVTSPELFTVTTSSSLLVQVTERSAASAWAYGSLKLNTIACGKVKLSKIKRYTGNRWPA